METPVKFSSNNGSEFEYRQWTPGEEQCDFIYEGLYTNYILVMKNPVD